MGPFIISAVLAALSAVSLAKSTSKKEKTDELYKEENRGLQDSRQVLLDFAQTVTEDPEHVMKNWTESTDQSVCSFDRVTCAVVPKGDKSVAIIEFNSLNLGGPGLSLVGFLDKLDNITTFHGNTNSFESPIPKIAHLKYLYELDLGNNTFNGSFPTQLINKRLTYLDLSFNRFTGKIPHEAISETGLDVLGLNNNGFTGEIPGAENASFIGLTLSYNNLTGPIPDSLANIPSLSVAHLAGNQLTGTVSEALCSLEYLSNIDVSDNPRMNGVLGQNCTLAVAAGTLFINGTGLQVNESFLPKDT